MVVSVVTKQIPTENEIEGTIVRKSDVIPILRTNQARRVIALILSIICSYN